MIRDAAYEALPKATRADLHRRFADWLEQHGQDIVELEEILGYHLEQAALYLAELGRNDKELRSPRASVSESPAAAPTGAVIFAPPSRYSSGPSR